MFPALIESRTKIYLSFWTRHWQGVVWPHPRKGQFTEHDTVTVIHSIPDAIDCLHHHCIVHRNHKHACFPPFHPPPLTYFTDPRISSATPMTCHRRLRHASPHPFPTLDPPFFSRLFTEQNSSILPTSNCHRLFGLVAPKVVKKLQPRKICGHLVHRYDRFQMHTKAKHKLITLSLYSHYHLHFPLRIPPFSRRQHHHICPAKRRPRNRVWDSILEGFWSSQVFFIWRLAALDPLHRPATREVLCDPWLTSLSPPLLLFLCPTLSFYPQKKLES